MQSMATKYMNEFWLDFVLQSEFKFTIAPNVLFFFGE